MVIIYTGNGKGKTTAALGLALRALGHGLRVLVIQFLKSSKVYGELKSAQKLFPNLEIIQVGKDCIYPADDPRRYQCSVCDFACHINPEQPDPADIASAQSGLALAEEEMKSGAYDIVILDEINYVLSYGLIPLDKVIVLIDNKPSKLYLVLTGRNADSKLIQRADLVTEMREIKHPLQKGIKSIKGIDF
jgi:cob(I)alamin adenosyltransferase